MTLGQEVTLMVGTGYEATSSRTEGSTAPVPALGIPALNQEDGPGGVADGMTGVTQLPAPEALAATFDTTAARCYGQVIGTEERGKGANLVYGPTINIVRVPQWGRAFESLGEDPVLTGTIATAEVAGIQGTGTMAEVKHYAVYNQETKRNTSLDNSLVSQKALHEIYLRAWDQVIAAGPAAVMCSYSTINGTAACQDAQLIKGYLDGSLGFPGFVGSDYGATHSTAASANAGLDQEQPSPVYFGQALISAVRERRASRATIDQAARRVLTEMYRFGLFRGSTTGNAGATVTSAPHALVSTEVAEEAMTLLSNRSGLLPLAARGGPVEVVGPAAAWAPVTGGGSATVTPPAGGTTPLQALRSVLAGKRQVSYDSGLPDHFAAIPAGVLSPSFGAAGATYRATFRPEATGTYVFGFSEPEGSYSPVTLSIDGTALASNPQTAPTSTYSATATLKAGRKYTLKLSGRASELYWMTPSMLDSAIASAAAAAKRASVAVVVVADDQESEAADRATLALPGAQDELVTAVAAANPRTVVVLEAGGPVTMPWLRKVSSVLDAWYPGQTGSSAVAAVLVGQADPSGHLPMTFPASASATPTASPAQFPGIDGKVHYSEGTDVGYRWHDATATAPLFPFGYGLSYTTFRFGHPEVSVGEAGHQPVVTTTVQLTNTGHRAGAEVAQLYIGEPPAADEPSRQLEAFQRVQLQPGRSTTVTFSLRGAQLGYYSSESASWRVAPGRYEIWVGSSSALPQLTAHTDFELATGAMVGPTSAAG
jgi:beta-glucosidase